MKRQILFIHSAGPQETGEGSSGLVTYLLNELGDEFEIRHPLMPEPENPRYEAWKAKLDKELLALKGEVILIGHSLGGSVILKFLSEEKCSNTIAGLFLISTPYWKKKNWEIDEYVLQKDFAKNLTGLSHLFLYHSKEDQWVPFSHTQFYAKKLPNAVVRELQGQEHEFSYGLPQLIEDIKGLDN
ncbi:MAG TPA: alpha/beta hydrolase [Cyclobacteriaceae bacterium]